MERRIHNPWTWQDEFGFVQAHEVQEGTRFLYCAGQAAVDDDGRPIDGDMAAQMEKAVDNLTTVLTQADFTLADVVRINTYVTDMPAFFENAYVLSKRLGEADCKYAGTLVQVSALAMPELVIELEATAIA